MGAIAPVVDLSSWFLGTDDERRVVAQQVGAAFSDGFLQVVGHGIDEETQTRALDAMEAFFARPESEKALTVPPDGAYRGWTRRRSEGFAATVDHVTPADLVEGFVCGAEDRASANPGDLAFAPNQWPADGALRTALWSYYLQARTLSEELLSICAIALGLNASYFVPHIDHANVTMRANFYERRIDDGALSDAQMALGAHTDYGICTVLLADPGPGLQVLTSDGRWSDLVPAPGALIVNVGDAMALWTNDRWPSTIHRVVPAAQVGGRPRRSIALFQDGNPDSTVACLPNCTLDRPARYEPTTLGAHVAAKVASSRTGQRATTLQTTAGRLAGE
jgi:isopenicillin N synthase-like dioxygenase